MDDHSLFGGRGTPETRRLAHEFHDARRSIQLTAEEQLRRHEEALAAALHRHHEIRKAAELEREQAARDILQHQQLLASQEALRIEQARKEAAERLWRLEQQRQEEIAAAQRAEEAAERQRQANAAAQEALSRARTPQNVPVQALPPPPPQSPPQSQPQPRVLEPPIETRTPIAKSIDPPAAIVPPVIKAHVNGHTNPPASTTNSTSKTYLGIPLPGNLPPTLQDQYLEYIRILHTLKEHRKTFKDQVLPDPRYKQAKAQVGDDRRFIRKSVSQLTEDRRKNRAIMEVVISKIKASLDSPFPKVSLSPYLLGSPSGAPEASSYYIYLLNIFAKAIFAQFLVDASSNPKKADAIGMFASQLLATVNLHWQNQVSFWPFLVAKFARRCAVLFGVYGNEAKTEGKILLGWGKEEGQFVTEQRHSERMTGLAAGWASLTLRDYGKSKLENPVPSWYFWRSAALILNVPQQEVTNTHYLVLKAMVEYNEQRILKLFGNFGRMILQQTVIVYPDNAYTGNKVSAQGLRLLTDVWAKDLHLRFR